MFSSIQTLLLRSGRVSRVRPMRSSGRSNRSSSYGRRSSGFGSNIGRWISRAIFWSIGWHIGSQLASFFGFSGLILIVIVVVWLARKRR
ncbi:hypothetical protein [Fructobacillus durionis]|uniref:Uncharacterized protein n=1 Tax=Fructobacillus durionis TaxID=283737 RepID=A0A1I1FMD9_9LACO|nr:hypothetical protein [Fructobacillus durionis]SFC00689.1 hypothetical protein SAMN05660453_0822 [Fructobacillus durionis]